MPMPPSRRPVGKTTSRAKPVRPRQRPLTKAKLNVAMACDTAFRIIARRYLDALRANKEATCNGDAMALHLMRVALTHLRQAIQFFSRMVDDAVGNGLRHVLKRLNGELGA